MKKKKTIKPDTASALRNMARVLRGLIRASQANTAKLNELLGRK